MATKTADVTIESKLRLLYNLQLIDSKIDELKQTRGELPLEIEDMEDRVEGLKTRVEKIEDKIKEYKEEIKRLENVTEESSRLIKKYNDQQKNVRNSREFNSITKEIQYQELEIELADKKTKDLNSKIETEEEGLKEEKKNLKSLQTLLKGKTKELKKILAETEKEEKLLIKKSEEFSEQIEKRLLDTYKRLRKNLKNGLAVVPIKRGASAGSFFAIPPQLQLEVATRKRIITDEHSGRILVDPDLALEEEEKIDNLFKSKI